MSSNKKKKCPYCGKRVPYFSAYLSRRKAEYVCSRCGKESRIVISKAVIPVFLVFVVISLGIMAAWIFLKMSSNPLGIAAVAFPLIIFALISPKYVRFEPLKKYKNSMEAKKAGIEYSDSFAVGEIDSEISSSTDGAGQFKINAEVFNKIKSDRNQAKEQRESDEIVSHSEKIDTPAEKTDQDDSFVPVIKPVSEEHSGTSAPLKKIHSEGTRINRARSHYIPRPAQPAEKPEPEKEIKSDTNRYSANRKF